MRRYPANSPQAAVRIAALTVFADGDIGEVEIEWLGQLSGHDPLGLARHEWHALLDALCGELLSSDQSKWADACPVDERTLADPMGDIQDPAMRLKLLRLCVELAESDAHVAEGESTVLSAALAHWGLHREMLRSSDRN